MKTLTSCENIIWECLERKEQRGTGEKVFLTINILKSGPRVDSFVLIIFHMFFFFTSVSKTVWVSQK